MGQALGAATCRGVTARPWPPPLPQVLPALSACGRARAAGASPCRAPPARTWGKGVGRRLLGRERLGGVRRGEGHGAPTRQQAALASALAGSSGQACTSEQHSENDRACCWPYPACRHHTAHTAGRETITWESMQAGAPGLALQPLLLPPSLTPACGSSAACPPR